MNDCWTYCNSLDSSCTGSNQVYQDRETCLAVCALMEPEVDELNSTANTLSCRLEKIGGGIEGNECPLVGPGGNGACGTNCQALCRLRRQLCSDVVPSVDQGPADCEVACEALYDRQDLDASGPDLTGDSVQCRLLQVALAARYPEEAAKHCEASQIRPTAGENSDTAPCSDPSNMDKGLECEKYCAIVMSACTEQYAVYQDPTQCLNTCLQTMQSGERGDQEQDTIRCRRYHAYFSMAEPAGHCMHASATGDGHCGTENCTSYCRILQRACGDDFERQFGPTSGTTGGGLDACTEACLPVQGGRAGLPGSGRDKFALPDPGLQRYALDPPPAGNTLMCRAYHAVEALTDPANHCAAALGGEPCQ